MISRSLGVIFTHSLAGAASTIALGLGYSGLSASWAERGAARARAASDAMEHNLFMVISRLVSLVLSLSKDASRPEAGFDRLTPDGFHF